MFPERHGSRGPGGEKVWAKAQERSQGHLSEWWGRADVEGNLWAIVKMDFYSNRTGKPLENLIWLVFKGLILPAAMRTVGGRVRVKVRKPVRKLIGQMAQIMMMEEEIGGVKKVWIDFEGRTNEICSQRLWVTRRVKLFDLNNWEDGWSCQ